MEMTHMVSTPQVLDLAGTQFRGTEVGFRLL